MGFPEYIYMRPDIDKLEREIYKLLEGFNGAENCEEQIKAVDEINVLRNNFETMKTLVEIRYSLNTEDMRKL